MKFSTLMTAALLCTGLAATSASAQTLKKIADAINEKRIESATNLSAFHEQLIFIRI